MRFCEDCGADNLPAYKRFCVTCAAARQRLRAKLCEARRREVDPDYRAKQAAFHRDRRRANPAVAAKHRVDAMRYALLNPAKCAANMRIWHAANPGYRTEQWHKRRARLRDGRSPGVTPGQWAEICEVFGRACAYCLRTDRKLTRDHVEPISRGGLDEPDNVVPACLRCNLSKGKKLLIAWGVAA